MKRPVSVGDVDVAGRMRNICHLPACAVLRRLPQHTARGHVLRGLGSTVPLTYPAPHLYTVLKYTRAARVSFLVSTSPPICLKIACVSFVRIGVRQSNVLKDRDGKQEGEMKSKHGDSKLPPSTLALADRL